MYKKIILLCLTLMFFNVLAFAQAKDQYKVGLIGFYNCENFYDTINQPDVQDEEFTPYGAKHYTATTYIDKLHNLATVLSQIGTDISPDGLSMFGCSEIENESVLQDLIHQPEMINRHYAI